MKWAVGAWLTLLLGMALSACGPSVQSIYEGNVRFEHCYRLDLDPDIAPTHRQACWEEWLHHYTYGQTRDRVQYARRRIRSLKAGDAARPVLNVGASDDPAQEGDPAEGITGSTAPVPTSAHVPPPPIARPVPAADGAEGEEGGRPETGNDAENAAPPPGANCGAACREQWDECRKTTCSNKGAEGDVNAGSETARGEDNQPPQDEDCAECQQDYRRCMKRCFE